MAEKNKPEKIEKEAKELTEKVLKLLGVKADLEVTKQEDVVKIAIEGEDLGLLIGYRGENLEGLQLILATILNNKWGFESWTPVVVDVGGWRKQREDSLRALVAKEAEKISAERGRVELPSMPPSQRRMVHLLVSEYDGLESESIGDEPNRHVVIKKTG